MFQEPARPYHLSTPPPHLSRVNIAHSMPQDPDWLTKPESQFRTILWLLGPFFIWFVGRAILRRYEAWEAALSESKARDTLIYLYKALANPPTLLESLAYIVCLLPIPFFIVALFLTLYFAPPASSLGALVSPRPRCGTSNTRSNRPRDIALLLHDLRCSNGLWNQDRVSPSTRRSAVSRELQSGNTEAD